MADGYSGQTMIVEDDLNQYYANIQNGKISSIILGQFTFYDSSHSAWFNITIDIYYRNSSGVMTFGETRNFNLTYGGGDSQRFHFPTGVINLTGYITNNTRIEFRVTNPTVNFVTDTGPYKTIYTTYSTPLISNINVSQRFTDRPTTVTFNVDFMNSFICNIKNTDGDILHTASGGTTPSVSIPSNIFAIGTNTVEIIATHINVQGSGSENITFENTNPAVTTLDPNSIQVNRSNPINAEFSGANVTTWAYECIQGGVAKFTTSGTGAVISPIPANVLSNGEAKNKLTATYIPSWATSPSDHKIVVKETIFSVYGAPSNPVLLVDNIYSTPYPLMRWSSASEQVSYRLKIKDGATVILDSLEVYGSTIREHLFDNPLTNHKTYTVELQIKNQYNLWSATVTATFQVEFAELAQPTFNIYADGINASIVINVESVPDINFHYHEIHRRELNGSWVKIARDLELMDEYKDFACASDIEYEYKVRAIDANTAYTDSVVKLCKVTFSKTILSIPFTDTFYAVRYNIKKSLDHIDDRTFVMYSGLSKPKMLQGASSYKSIGISCTLRNKDEYDKFIDIVANRVLLLRDGRGFKSYGAITSIKDSFEHPIYSNTSFNFTEVYYKEGDYIENEQRPLSFADSEW
jgi:hypothetical protein